MKAFDVAAWQEKIRATNADFKKAGKAKKRVLLAEDVIAAIAANRFGVEDGAYLDLPGSEHRLMEALADSAPYAPPATCQVCAKGALFVAKIDRLNKVTVGNMRHHGFADPSDELTAFFSQDQLNLIETAFEVSPCKTLKANAAIRFGDRYANPSARLRAIMENVVRNDGTFDPEDVRVTRRVPKGRRK